MHRWSHAIVHNCGLMQHPRKRMHLPSPGRAQSAAVPPSTRLPPGLQVQGGQPWDVLPMSSLEHAQSLSAAVNLALVPCRPPATLLRAAPSFPAHPCSLQSG